MKHEDYIDSLLGDRLNGINIDADEIFSQAGEHYFIAVGITIAEMDMSFPIAAKNIVELRWENKVNSLFMTGNLIFRDTSGKAGALNGSLFSHVSIHLAKVTKQQNADGSMNWTEESDHTFEHSFLVDNVELMDREANEVDYNLHLVSDTWFASKKLLYFSNYDKLQGNTRPQEDFNVFKILMTLFTTAFKDYEKNFDLCIKGQGFDPEGFEKAAGDCNVLVDYATNTRTTLLDAFDYLMNRTYYDKNEHDKALRFLVYDAFEKQFKLLDFKDYETFIETSDQGMVVSLQGGPAETFVTPTKQNFSSLNIITAREFMESFIKYTWIDYNPNFEEFVGGERKDNASTLTTSDFVEYVDPKKTAPSNKIFRLKEDTKQREAYDMIFNDETLLPDADYTKIDTIWGTTLSLYKDQIYNTLYRDALVFNTNGKVRHGPGTLIIIKNEEAEAQLGEDMQNMEDAPHGDITDIMLVVKTTHIVRPGDPSDEKFTENLVMQRWWSSKA